MNMRTSIRPGFAPLTGGNRENLPFLLSLIAAGVAGNFLSFSLFFNIDFLFGSIFALLALQRFGLRSGVIAAALISAYTIILWNHPYACVILTAEVAVVGWLLRHRRIGLVLAATLYWLCIGMPLVYVFYHWIMDISLESTSIVMIKQAVNGIGNAMIARLLFATYTLLSPRKLLPFREIISTLLGFFVLCPALVILTLDSRAEYTSIDRHIRDSLVHDRDVLSEELQNWLNNRKTAIATLANLATNLPTQQMQYRLEQTRTSDHNFLRVSLLDKGATIVAIAPLTDELGYAHIGQNFSDRPFIPLLKEKLQPMLSEVVMARIGPAKPVALVLAPIVIKTGYNGFVVGALNLDHINNILAMNASRDGQNYTLLDRNDKIITTNDKTQKIMTPLQRSPGKLYPLDRGLGQWIPTLPTNTPTMERWKKSSYITSTNIGTFSEWSLILEQPVAPFQKQLYNAYSRKLSLLFIILLGALLFAELLSRLITHTNEELLAITSDLPTRLSGDYPIAWPKSAIFETQRLIENFRAMSVTLSTQFNDIRKINSSLEERMNVRTWELSESRERYDLALLGSQDGIWDWDVLNNKVYFSARWFEMLGYTENEREPTFALFESLVHPDDLAKIHESLRRHLKERIPYSIEFRMLRKDGEFSWILARGQALWNDQGQAVRMAGSHTDITERKCMEEDLRANQTRLNLAHRVAHLGNWEWHPQTGELYWSEENYHIFGLDPQLPPSFDTFIATVAPEERPLIEESIATALSTGASYDIDFTVIRPDNGDRRVINARAEVRKDEAGRAVQLIGTVQDVSIRKQLEKSLRESNLLLKKIYASLNEAIFIVETGTRRILDCNITTEKMFGYTQSEMIGADTSCLHLSEEMSQLFGSEMLRSYADKGLFETTFQMKRKDGSIFDSEHSVTPIHDDQGVVISHVCVVRDISERKKSENLLLASLREKEVLLKEIHHRVKNNLQIVYSLLALQSSSIADRDIRTLFDESRNRIGSMALIHEKIYTSKDLSHIDFSHYLQELTQNIAGTFLRPEIELVVTAEPVFLDINNGIPCGLIVNELVSNSFKYAFPSGRAGRITIGLTQHAGGRYLLTVADDGIGFPADLDFLKTTSLGLQLVTVLTGQLRGEISLSTDGGTQFSISFPAEQNKERIYG